MIFFTDITTDASKFCLLNIRQYNSPRKANKKIIFIDPGVYDLLESPEYENVEKIHELARSKLPDNEFISIDYPCDMNKKFSDLFIEKSIANNKAYANNLHYICTIQARFSNYFDFFMRAEELKPIWSIPGKIVGIGNLCRFVKISKRNRPFLDGVFSYVATNMKGKHVHFYGLAKQVIIAYIPRLERLGITCSTDSTKWTRAHSKKLKDEHGFVCKKANRDIFFADYMREISKSCKIEF